MKCLNKSVKLSEIILDGRKREREKKEKKMKKNEPTKQPSTFSEFVSNCIAI